MDSKIIIVWKLDSGNENTMATKHIKDATWRKVEEKTVKAVIETRTNIKETEMLDFLINLGIEKMSEDDFQRIKKRK